MEVKKLENNTPLIHYGEIIDVAEHKTYLELTSRVCYYNEPNLNNVMLEYNENAENIANTLCNMPVQARYRVSPDGKPTFSGHEMHKTKDGKVTFSTVSIGTHIKTWIEKDNVVTNDGSVKELPCLFATYRLWKRYPNMIAAAKRLFNEGKLYNSWEINTYKYVYDNGIKKLTDYEFLADTLLGYEYSYPSYGTSANAISMAELEENSSLMIAEALSQDLLENQDKEVGESMVKENMSKVTTDVKEVAENIDKTIAEENKPSITEVEHTDNTTTDNTEDVAQLTVIDLRQKVEKACREKLRRWCYIDFLFPNEKEVWCEYEGAESQLDFVKFTYTVDENDIVTVSEPEYVKLTVSIAEINTKVASLEKEIDTVKAELDIKNNAITKASETIQQLKVQVSELTPYKEQAEAAEQERINSEIAEQKEKLKAKLLKGNLFTEEEIASKEIAELIETRNESAINNLIADKFIASLDNEPENEIAEKGSGVATVNLESDDDEAVDARSFMRSILLK